MSNKSLIRNYENPFLDLARKFFDDDFLYVPSVNSDYKKNAGLSNILENGDKYLVEISAPGLKKENVKIELENDILKIYSNLEDSKEEKTENYYRREFFKSSFERNFIMPKNVDKEKISANMEDGILTVSIPKIKEEKKKENITITIK